MYQLENIPEEKSVYWHARFFREALQTEHSNRKLDAMKDMGHRERVDFMISSFDIGTIIDYPDCNIYEKLVGHRR